MVCNMELGDKTTINTGIINHVKYILKNLKWGDVLRKHHETKHMSYFFAKFMNYILLFQKGKLQVKLTRKSLNSVKASLSLLLL